MISPIGLAQTIIDGKPQTIGANAPASENYLVRNAGSLTANGARTAQIRVQTGSSVQLNNTQVTASGSTIGVDLSASDATITNKSKVVSSTTGLRLAQTANGGSKATVNDSEIIGGAVGASLSAQSQLTLEAGAKVTGSNADSIGIRSFGGRISATDSTITGGLNGISLFADQNLSADNALVLNNSHVEGLSGSPPTSRACRPKPCSTV